MNSDEREYNQQQSLNISYSARCLNTGYVSFVLCSVILIIKHLLDLKDSDIDNVLSKLIGSHPSLNFTVDKLDDGVVNHLDLKIIDNETDIYHKDTHTGQYMHFASYTPWNIKTAWIRALCYRATEICINQKLLDDQMKKILSFMPWNGFPNYVSKPLLGRMKSNSTKPSSNNSIEKNNISEIIFRLPYAENIDEQHLKRCLKKVKRCLHMTKGTTLFVKSSVLVAIFRVLKKFNH